MHVGIFPERDNTYSQLQGKSEAISRSRTMATDNNRIFTHKFEDIGALFLAWMHTMVW